MLFLSPSLRFAIVLAVLVVPLPSVIGQEATEANGTNHCEVVPLAGHQVSFQIDGVEKLRWHFGKQYPRPFFFPFSGPSGASLTRMGHPGAPNHDHHQSVWFAHNSVTGFDFWANGKRTQIRQKNWNVYEGGNSTALMAVSCGWYDPHGNELMQQEFVAELLPMANNEHALELQVMFHPPPQVESVELGKTNFGFLAVRVAKSISKHFGGGTISNSEGQVDETNIFGKPARWMDYSGPVAVGEGANRKSVIEGITYFDHPKNPRYPTHWHVREDGWMGASFNMNEGFRITNDAPLKLRYLLHAHAGPYHHSKAEAVHQNFAARSDFEIIKSQRKHRQFEVRRVGQ